MPDPSAVAPLHIAIIATYVVMSLVALALYRGDKSASMHGGRRTPERALHLVSLAGGWPGALIAQRAFRHKTRKQPFQTVFWLTVLANCGAVAWLLGWIPAPPG